MPLQLELAQGRWLGQSAVAGVVGGAAYGLYEAVAMQPRGLGRWGHMNAVGATVPWFRPVDDRFHWNATTTGMVLHAVTSAIGGAAYGTLLSAYAPRQARSERWETLLGLGWGVVFWTTWGLLVGPSVDPPMERTMVRDRRYLVGHLIYGVVTALVLGRFARGRAMQKAAGRVARRLGDLAVTR